MYITTSKHSSSQLGQTTPPNSNFNLLASLFSGPGNSLVIKSQLTPDITIDLSQMVQNMQSGQPVSSTVVQGTDNPIFSFIKPEIQLNLLGLNKTVAPYGEPTDNYGVVILASVVGLMAIGAATAFWFCKRR